LHVVIKDVTWLNTVFNGTTKTSRFFFLRNVFLFEVFSGGVGHWAFSACQGTQRTFLQLFR